MSRRDGGIPNVHDQVAATTPPHEVGAVIFRRARGFWAIDEFAPDGSYLGSHGGNHSYPRIEGWRSHVWPDEPTLLDSLQIPMRRRRTLRLIAGLLTERRWWNGNVRAAEVLAKESLDGLATSCDTSTALARRSARGGGSA